MALSKTSKTKAGAKEEQNELVEFEPKDDDESNEATANNCDTEAITKEGECHKNYHISYRIRVYHKKGRER
ncbi:PREDICTED: uncharacterized protein LOC108620285 isoform X2 [Drosophila arizonae]|uniref:Uncharacterized protein LOC108620285 isoform X2 n=1 Tax=Drosophila arizonae TaxID=7263 RepID=A0ABM1PZP3_DROAR|nr:PREDICTED: uncharacterized protein LOC108620285 isoform X2 [Drosophila arizonae]